jgi:hypothetical protein
MNIYCGLSFSVTAQATLIYDSEAYILKKSDAESLNVAQATFQWFWLVITMLDPGWNTDIRKKLNVLDIVF